MEPSPACKAVIAMGVARYVGVRRCLVFFAWDWLKTLLGSVLHFSSAVAGFQKHQLHMNTVSIGHTLRRVSQDCS